jgi:signal peptidase I
MLSGRLQHCSNSLIRKGHCQRNPLSQSSQSCVRQFHRPSNVHLISRLNLHRQQQQPNYIPRNLVQYARCRIQTKSKSGEPIKQSDVLPLSTSKKTSLIKRGEVQEANISAEEGGGSLYLGTHVWRLVCAFGFVYVVTEYGIELTICEGPSMMPTIQPRAEIVVMDRCTPRLWGLQGGPAAIERAIEARILQRQHVKEQKYLPKTPTRKQTWYDPRIPVNRLPKDGGWSRLRKQLSSGISVGDVVVLQHPDRIGTVCKRVLGLPGDVVTKPTTRRGASRMLTHEGHVQTNLAILKRRRSAAVVEIPDGHIWVEGDNPWNSSDSRDYGPVPANLIMGRVLFRVWPLRGSALMERGDRPIHDDTTDRPSMAYSGSVVFPAGYEDQIISNRYDDNELLSARSQDNSSNR